MVFMMEHDISFKSPTGSHDDNNVYSDRRVHVTDETRSACETAAVDDGDRPRQWKKKSRGIGLLLDSRRQRRLSGLPALLQSAADAQPLCDLRVDEWRRELKDYGCLKVAG